VLAQFDRTGEQQLAEYGEVLGAVGGAVAAYQRVAAAPPQASVVRAERLLPGLAGGPVGQRRCAVGFAAEGVEFVGELVVHDVRALLGPRLLALERPPVEQHRVAVGARLPGEVLRGVGHHTAHHAAHATGDDRAAVHHDCSDVPERVGGRFEPGGQQRRVGSDRVPHRVG